jgi:hypothetical protein
MIRDKSGSLRQGRKTRTPKAFGGNVMRERSWRWLADLVWVGIYYLWRDKGCRLADKTGSVVKWVKSLNRCYVGSCELITM